MATAKVDIASFKETLKHGNTRARAELASSAATPPEILCFLTEDGEAEVRRAVADNPNTPATAQAALSRDPDISVRVALARTMVGDGLDESARQTLWRTGFTILETLMRDQVVRVRNALASGLASKKEAPHPVVLHLARDKAEKVATPILSNSPVLTDSDMIDYLRDGAPDWAQTAMAGRTEVSGDLGAGLTDVAGPIALATLAGNGGAFLTESVLEELAARAETESGLQEPLAGRNRLPGSILVRLARFVASPLLSRLCGRTDIDRETARRMNRAIETRIDMPDVRAVPGATAIDNPVSPASPGNDNESSVARASNLFREGKLTDDAIALALDSNRRDFVIAALALRAGMPEDRARRMADAGSARTMVALSWKAGLSARFALDLQRSLARIPHTKVINARNGLDYALTPAEMTEQLALFA